MKVQFVFASAVLALSSTMALAGGWGGSKHIGAPQFAHSSAVNFAGQVAKVAAIANFGKIKQSTGAAAEAVNVSKCGCKGLQVAKAESKNVSLQIATVTAGLNHNTISQSAVSTSLAKNIRR